MGARSRLLLTGPILAGALACGNEPSGPPSPSALTVSAGNGQTGAVGAALPAPVQVRVTTGGGAGVSGVQVTFAVSSGGGLVAPGTATTDASGFAQTSWILGPTMGTQTLTANAAGLTAATIQATAIAGDPAQIVGVTGQVQFTVVGRPVSTLPQGRVADQFGNPLAGIPVTFAVTVGGGSITGAVQTSDATGLVTLGGWTVGPAAGTNRVRASVNPEVGQDFVAIGTPASIEVLSGDGQTANVGTLVETPPAVLALNDAGQPVPGADVAFVITGGGGQITGTSVRQTNAQGIAQVGGWIVGTSAGPNTLDAQVGGIPSVRFSATGVSAVPASLVAASPALSGFLGNFLSDLPVARVVDADGRPVAGITVRFDLVGGGGVILGNVVTTNFDGHAALGVWRLGAIESQQTVRASVDGVPILDFVANATAPPPSQFTIEVRFPDAQPTEAQSAAFTQAAARWRQAIIGDLPAVPLNLPAESFGCFPALNETVDDVLIFARLVTIDGPGGVLGQARPCLVRTASGLTIVGLMQFDTADLPFLEDNNLLDVVILHEMGHVLGIGSLWVHHNLIVGRGGGDPFFTGPSARAAFQVAALPGGYAGQIVPVHNEHGPGSRDVHWRESVVTTELMSPFVSVGVNPMSAFTIASLRDMGYVVNDANADTFTLAAALQLLTTPALQLHHGAMPGVIRLIDRDGRITGTIFP